MIASLIPAMVRRQAGAAFVMRMGIVGVNLGVMLGLAWHLGLDGFGALTVGWSMALVAATLMSVGGPLSLLAAVGGGKVASLRVIARLVVIYPAILGALAWAAGALLWPGPPWMAIVAAGFCINLLTCLASVMRGLGSVHISMCLRDAAPQVALLVAALGGGASAAPILLQAAVWMAAMGLLAGVWCVHQTRCSVPARRDATSVGLSPAMWGTAVIGMVLSQIDIIVGGALMTSEHVGLYALLRRVANLVALPVSVATWVSAAAVSGAHDRSDRQGLQTASLRGSRIALFPGAALFVVACASLPVLHWIVPGDLAAAGRWSLAILLGGAMVQVVLASGFTLSTLCGLPHLAALARLMSVLAYLAIIALAGVATGPVQNACAYVAGTALGSILLWHAVRVRLGVDTSAMALFNRKEAGWRPS